MRSRFKGWLNKPCKYFALKIFFSILILSILHIWILLKISECGKKKNKQEIHIIYYEPITTR